MHARRARSLVSRTWGMLVMSFVCLVLVPVAAAKPALPKRTGYAKVVHACPQPKPQRYSCDALVRVPVSSSDAGTPGVERYTFGDGDHESGPSGGLTPGDLASAYEYDPTASGTGQTVAIVDAFDDPNIESDLATFDSHYGLTKCTTEDGCLTKVSQTGSTTSLPKADTTGWSVEISLDVETVHSVCPECKILLVEAKNEESQNLAAAVNEAVAMKATEISNSYGGPEGSESSEASAYNHPGTVIAAATGDSGWDDWTDVFRTPDLPERPNAPASLPTVVAVGGTTLELNSEGKRTSESVWNGNGPVDESPFIEGATGGGCSTLFNAESWQHDAPGFAASGCGDKRLAADVSAVGDPNTGFDIYDTYDCGTSCEEFKREGEDWVTVGGTSLSTPIISALYALAGGSNGVSYPSLTLYGHLASHSSLFDVTEGGSGFCGGARESLCGHPDAFGALVEGFTLDVDCEYTTACNAAPGYDGPSGVGTPTGLGLFKPLGPTAAITAPSSLRVGVGAAFSGTSSSDPYPGGSITGYVWKWGDGSESTGSAPTHTYSAAGKYTVTLTITDNYGFTSAPATQTVKVLTVKEAEEEEAAAKKKAEEEAAAKKKAEEEAAAKKKAEEEAAAKKKAEEEAAAKKKAEEEATAKKHAEEEAATRKKEEEAAAKTKAEEAKKTAEEAKKTAEEAKKTAEEEVIKKKGEEAAELKAKEAAKTLAEEQARKQAEAQVAAKKAEEEAAAKAALAKLAAQEVSAFRASLALAVPNAQIVGTSLHVSSSGALKLKISCPKGESTCLGTVTLRTLTAVIASSGRMSRAKAAVLTLASGSFSMAGGADTTITLHLSSKARALLAKEHTLRVRATLLAHDLQGAHHTTQTIVVLHAAKAAHHKS
jgi:PKD repeat protein